MDLLNLGGQKLMPELIEVMAMSAAGVDAVIAVGVICNSGYEEV